MKRDSARLRRSFKREVRELSNILTCLALKLSQLNSGGREKDIEVLLKTPLPKYSETDVGLTIDSNVLLSGIR